ncbi:hypothetical protein NAG83_24125 [Pseudomonas carnis]|uniref:hypothetical protein n=1 Tax=Pseudomonas carnis TaxID=2487355 RepID=UPI0020946A99|nr:hypothetical protein [Pseudomonas carnis]MCO7039596.1 hypothetical protein [Pseudomonas carnis]
MSKFLKFEDALSLELSMILLSSLTGEAVDKEILRRLVGANYLAPLIGQNNVLIGFKFDEIKKIINGGVGVSFVLSDIGVPCCKGAIMLNDSFVVTTAQVKDEGLACFVRVKPDLDGAEQIKESYELDDLLPVDPWDADQWSFLVKELYQVADMANEIGVPGFPLLRQEEPELVVEKSGIMSDMVVSIDGMSYPYPTGKSASSEKMMLVKTSGLDEDIRPSHTLVVSVLLDLLAEPGRAARNQSAIIADILERHPTRRGLSKRNLEAIFSAANKAASAAS